MATAASFPAPFLYQERNLLWSSAADAHLLQGWTRCTVRDALLHTTVVNSGYLSLCGLYSTSNEPADSRLTFLINNMFSATKQSAHRMFFLYHVILCIL